MVPICGIAGVYFRDPEFMDKVDLDAMLTTLLDEIDHRGKHACGYVALTDDGVGQWQKAAVQAKDFNLHRQRVPQGTRALLAHTRWATQGSAGFMENNHPVRRGPFYIIHNGHISNDWELMLASERKRYGSVDSEAIAARLASFGDLTDIDKVMAEVRGTAAVAAVDERDCKRLVVAKGRSNPLFVYNGKRIVIFASTEKAVVNAHSKYVGAISVPHLIEMEEGEMFEWKDDDVWSKEFKVPTYTSWSPGEHSIGTDYRPWVIHKNKSNGKGTDKKGEEKKEGKKGKGQKEETPVGAGMADSRLFPGEEGVEWMTCENCDTRITWDECNYYRPEKTDKVSFIVCDSCFDELVDDDELWEEAAKEALESGVLTLADLEDEVGPVDDYEGANKHLINAWLKKFL